ncbi:hypothetical protein IVB27_32420 [Bradyrhizobium sp. 197]|uniref:hypothetical protein n=1 Tax=Bradyrhizobium sp. 197 TaxID=2782663 RepID=UPI001FF76A04|nr:hypothetical protein [Bradyrhizobium sp. 197]MCK1479320.1 hypothetical protein [Bradyrhizobium sp. 197]
MKKLIPIQPWHPAAYDEADVYAIKALVAGKANEGQQQRAIGWIINTLCGTYDLSFRPDSDRDTVFAEGKRHVGMQIIKLTKLVIKQQ